MARLSGYTYKRRGVYYVAYSVSYTMTNTTGETLFMIQTDQGGGDFELAGTRSRATGQNTGAKESGTACSQAAKQAGRCDELKTLYK